MGNIKSIKPYLWKYRREVFPKIFPYSSSNPFEEQTRSDYLISIFNSEKELQEIFPYFLKRVFITFGGDETTVRGNHAHYKTFELLVVLRGYVTIILDNTIRKEKLILKEGDSLLIGPKVWRELINYSLDNVNLFLCSTDLNNKDYIRNYVEFKEYMVLNDSKI